MELVGLNVAEAEEGDEGQGSSGGGSQGGCCERLHKLVSRWMLPEDARASYLARANCLPPPLFILTISAAELSVFIYYAVWKPQNQWITLDTGIWESPLTYRPDKRTEAWRFLSYMLVHAGIEHILGNLVLQLVLGIPLELVHKGHRVGLVYLAGVLGGSLASSVCDPLLGLVGASGGVYALIGGYFMNVLVNFREMIPLFGVARLLFIFLIVGTDVGFALYRRFLSHVDGLKTSSYSSLLRHLDAVSLSCAVFQAVSLTLLPLLCKGSMKQRLCWQPDHCWASFPSPVSFVAHIAGGLAGMSVGYVIFSSFDKNFVKDPRFWVCIVGYLLFVVFAVLFNVFFSPANQ